MNNQSELSLDDLRSLLENNEIKNFDPVAEAFKVYDPQETVRRHKRVERYIRKVRVRDNHEGGHTNISGHCRHRQRWQDILGRL